MRRLLVIFALAAACSALENDTRVYVTHYRDESLFEMLQKNTLKILDVKRQSNHTFVVRTVKDELGEVGIERTELITLGDNFLDGDFHAFDDDDDFIYAPTDSREALSENATRGARGLMNKCNQLNDVNCVISSNSGKVFFKIGYKFLTCSNSSTNRIKFRFRARLPGTYIMRISATRGSYVVVARTYKKFQAIAFLWPRHLVHLGENFKMHLMVQPHSGDELFDGSFSWSWIDLECILDGSVASRSADFDVIFRKKNVALLEQMSRFDNNGLIKIASCTFDTSLPK